MTPSPPSPPDRAHLPSTLRGPGWRPRALSHRDDLEAGLWGAPMGSNSEIAPLREVLLTRPGPALHPPGTAADWLMDARPDPGRLVEQAEAVSAAFRAAGVAVGWIEPSEPAPPNLLFARDLFFMTPEGAILARMAAQQRAGEERFAAAALARRGVPILATPRGHATFEGADALWLDPRTVLVGVGRRTNRDGFACVSRALADQGVTAHAVEVPDTSQHLLGALILVDEGLALTLRPTPSITQALDRHGWRAVSLPADPETGAQRAANLVTLAPGHVLMPAGCPQTTDTLSSLGLICDAVEVGEYVKAAGALGCLTGVVHRGAVSPA